MPKMQIKLLPKAQQTQGIEYFDSFNTFCSKQKLQHALKSWSNLSLALFFGKGRGMQRTLTNPFNNLAKTVYRFRQIPVSILTNPCNNLEKSINQF